MSNGLHLTQLVHPFPFFLRDYCIVKGCLLDSFNTVFNHVCPSFPFVPKGLMDNKECQMDSF